MLAFAGDHAWSFLRTGAAAGSGLGIAWEGASPLVELDTPADLDHSTHFETYDAAANGPDDVWVVGERNIAASDGSPAGETLGFMHYDGSGWSLLPSPLGDSTFARARAVVVESSGQVWAGHDAQIPPAIFHFDGMRWAVEPFVPASAEEERITLREMVREEDGTIWAAGARFVGPLPDFLANEPDTRVSRTFLARRSETPGTCPRR